jgi:hypothetical protein
MSTATAANCKKNTPARTTAGAGAIGMLYPNLHIQAGIHMPCLISYSRTNEHHSMINSTINCLQINPRLSSVHELLGLKRDGCLSELSW